MKVIYILLIFIALPFSVFSQDQSLVGKWKTQSLKSDKFYQNFITDSIWVAEDARELFRDTSFTTWFKEHMKIIGSITILFDDKGNYKLSAVQPDINDSGKYVIKTKEEVILTSDIGNSSETYLIKVSGKTVTLESIMDENLIVFEKSE